MSRLVVITGVSGGIGAPTAAMFESEGWRVAGIDRQDAPTALKLEAFLAADLSRSDVQELLRAFFAGLDRLDALVNAAAIPIAANLLDTEIEAWDEVMATNVRGAFLASNAAHPRLTETGGAIVNVGSVHAYATSPGAGAYAASKGALSALTRAAALEWAPAIRVNAVIPGAVDTPMLRNGLRRLSNAKDGHESHHALAARTPLQRIGRPDEIAQAVLFLADAQRSSFITGECLTVDGGALVRLSIE
jgi:NAD(P)-dependent dehydrogenase (short-subunit alcohol dehydrogenase family)